MGTNSFNSSFCEGKYNRWVTDLHFQTENSIEISSVIFQYQLQIVVDFLYHGAFHFYIIFESISYEKKNVEIFWLIWKKKKRKTRECGNIIKALLIREPINH